MDSIGSAFSLSVGLFDFEAYKTGYQYYPVNSYIPAYHWINHIIHFLIFTDMETKSISSNGISVCRKGEENYSRFCAGAFRGTIYYQYDYRHLNGDLFTTISQTLDECREKRDKWVQQKNYAGL
ncbi:hypothetical protein EZS27_043690, partial [termite gut metagenome]